MITINCIGLGHWGPNLLRNFSLHPEVEIGMICDTSQERLDLVSRKLPGVGKSSCSDPMQALTDPDADAVVIVTPVKTHFELAKTALEHGKHVLVEKPLCATLEESEALVDLARKKGKLLAVGHVFLFNQGVLGVRNLIKTGALGRISYVYATRTNLGPIRTDVNALWDLAAHDISILNHWFNEDPIEVSARGESYLNPSIEDVVLANYTYPGGILAAVHASWLNPRKVREITIVGEHKMVVWDDMQIDEPIRIFDKTVDVSREPVYSDNFGSFRMQIRTGDVVIPHVAGSEPLASECAHFVDAISGREELINDGDNGISVVKALEAADRSMAAESRIVKL